MVVNLHILIDWKTWNWWSTLCENDPIICLICELVIILCTCKSQLAKDSRTCKEINDGSPFQIIIISKTMNVSCLLRYIVKLWPKKRRYILKLYIYMFFFSKVSYVLAISNINDKSLSFGLKRQLLCTSQLHVLIFFHIPIEKDATFFN